MRAARGFTFVEILVVITIILILMSVSLPRLAGTVGHTRLTTSARDVTALLRFARDAAVLTEQQTEVRFDPEGGRYQLVVTGREGERVEIRRRRRSRNSEDRNNLLALGAEYLQGKSLPNRVHFQAIYTAAPLTEDTELPRVIFYPDGSATPATIAMQNDDLKTLRVEIYRTTGMTRVEEGLPPEVPETQRLYYGRGR